MPFSKCRTYFNRFYNIKLRFFDRDISPTTDLGDVLISWNVLLFEDLMDLAQLNANTSDDITSTFGACNLDMLLRTTNCQREISVQKIARSGRVSLRHDRRTCNETARILRQ